MSADSQTVGASGAVFGLMAALFLLERQRGVALLGGSVGALLAVNLVFTFVFPGVSIGGHIGGILGGAAAASPSRASAGATWPTGNWACGAGGRWRA